MEGCILEALNFDFLAQPTPVVYLELILEHAKLEVRDGWLARYLLEVSAFDLGLQRFSPALLAYSIVFFIKKMRGYGQFGEEKMKGLIGGSEGEVRTIGRELCGLWHKAEKQDSLGPLRTKYAQKQFCEVSKIRLAERSR